MDFGGVHVWAHCRHGATVGCERPVDAGNVEPITQVRARAVATGSRLVLDLSGVGGLHPLAIALLTALDERRSRRAWTGPSVRATLPPEAAFRALSPMPVDRLGGRGRAPLR